MYGKIFSSMYEGSLVGAGPVVFAVWGYCISKAEAEESTVMLNPVLLSQIIGTSQEEIRKAIDFLCAPDNDSKNKEHEGRRLLLLSGLCYFVVSHKHYRSINNMADVREYHKVMKRKQRESKDVPDSPGLSGTPVSVSVSSSVDVIAKGVPKKGVDIESLNLPGPLKEAFASWVEARRVGKSPVTAKALELGVNRVRQLSNGSTAAAVKIVEQTVISGWRGFFPLKDDSSGGKAVPREELPGGAGRIFDANGEVA